MWLDDFVSVHISEKKIIFNRTAMDLQDVPLTK